MEYERTSDDESVTEWTRSDGHATIRLRERTDGRFAVRYDQLHQADGGRSYAYETVEDRASADALVAEWREEPPE